jgi:hypothetical protein
MSPGGLLMLLSWEEELSQDAISKPEENHGALFLEALIESLCHRLGYCTSSTGAPGDSDAPISGNAC